MVMAALVETSTVRISEQPGFIVVGYRVRTTNAAEATPNGQIGKLWQRISSDRALEHIPNRADSNIYAVYTDYETDENGPYTFVLGVKVSKDPIPAHGMVSQRVLPGRYALFESEAGAAQEVVIRTWKRIWSWPDRSKRLYKTDYEVHSPNANPNDARVTIFIGVK